MTGYESSSLSQASSQSSKDENNYYQLLHSFKELHDEAYRIVVLNNCLKCLNNLLENKVNLLEK